MPMRTSPGAHRSHRQEERQEDIERVTADIGERGAETGGSQQAHQHDGAARTGNAHQQFEAANVNKMREDDRGNACEHDRGKPTA